MNLTNAYKNKVRDAILENRANFGGSDAAFAKSMGINASAYSRLKNGEVEQIIKDADWLMIGARYNVRIKESNWNIARTSVYTEIEDNLKECQKHALSMILVDDCGIGKTECSKHIIRGMKNAFYMDCSQSKTRIQFTRALARTLGVDDKGRHIEVKERIKYALNVLENVLIVLDEAGDVDYQTILLIKEFWNAGEGNASWYMMGAEGFRAKMERGVNNKKVGFAETLSRFSEKFITISPTGKADRRNFYAQLIGDVAAANAPQADINNLIRNCYDKVTEKQHSLRHLKTQIRIA